MCLFPTPLTLLWLGQMKLDAWKQKCVQSDSREAVYVCICICVCVCVCVCVLSLPLLWLLQYYPLDCKEIQPVHPKGNQS